MARHISSSLSFYLVTPSPFIPLPLIKGKGELFLKRGKAPLKLLFNIFLTSPLEEKFNFVLKTFLVGEIGDNGLT